MPGCVSWAGILQPRSRKADGLPGVEVAGGVPDVRPHLAAARLLVVPLETGGGFAAEDPGSVRRGVARRQHANRMRGD